MLILVGRASKPSLCPNAGPVVKSDRLISRHRCHLSIRRKLLMPTSNEIYEKVREILVDALGADESECTLDATLMGDLGAESIDFLDIVFRLEKTFNVEDPAR